MKLDPKEKYNRIIAKTALIEDEVKRKERLLSVKRGAEQNLEISE